MESGDDDLQNAVRHRVFLVHLNKDLVSGAWALARPKP